MIVYGSLNEWFWKARPLGELRRKAVRGRKLAQKALSVLPDGNPPSRCGSVTSRFWKPFRLSFITALPLRYPKWEALWMFTFWTNYTAKQEFIVPSFRRTHVFYQIWKIVSFAYPINSIPCFSTTKRLYFIFRPRSFAMPRPSVSFLSEAKNPEDRGFPEDAMSST